MRNKKLKIVFTIVLVLICIFSISHTVFADNFKFDQFDDINIEAKKSVDKDVQNVMGTAIVVIRVVATAVSVIMLSYIGIKYMLASANEKADMKKGLAIYVVGAVLVFAAGNIMTLLGNFAKNI